MNGLSENVSFNSELTLAFEIKAFKVAFFDFFFNANFSKYSRVEWVNVQIIRLMASLRDFIVRQRFRIFLGEIIVTKNY